LTREHYSAATSAHRSRLATGETGPSVEDFVMRRARTSVCLAASLILLLVLSTTSVTASQKAAVYSPNAHPNGMSLVDLAQAWTDWAWQPAETSPLLNARCDYSGIGKIWFAPVSINTAQDLDCTLPPGGKLLITPGGYECSTAEGNGETLAELTGCAETLFASEICCEQMIVDGVELTNLDRYLFTTPGQLLAGPNLFGPDPTLTVERGWFILLRPMSVGEHEVYIYDEAPNFDLIFSTTIHITVAP
jgi:hypothetical protein